MGIEIYAPTGHVIHDQPTAKKETAIDDGKFGQIEVKDAPCCTISRTDLARYAVHTTSFFAIGFAGGVTLPLIVSSVCGPITPVAIGAYALVGVTPGAIGILGSAIYVAATPIKEEK